VLDRRENRVGVSDTPAGDPRLNGGINPRRGAETAALPRAMGIGAATKAGRFAATSRVPQIVCQTAFSTAPRVWRGADDRSEISYQTTKTIEIIDIRRSAH
jgi:hypothetical protein